ncbi:dihydrofolate reductase-like domain-containing protein [Mycena amicta]|nr:dihydrofolate reductase-like domain-containing protein [Mycena amicta]
MLPPTYLTNLIAPFSEIRPATRPHVTLTFAQSLDGKIGGAGGSQLALSGKQSIIMTHWLRTLHDAILVGIATALNDDPQLNTRHLPPSDERRHVPRPIVLDSNLRLPPTCNLLKNYAAGNGRRPWIVAMQPSSTDDAWEARQDALTAAGAKILFIEQASDRTAAALALLHEQGIQSLMVEGGARIIESFLASGSVDILLITTAPVLVGDQGVGYSVPFQGNRYRVVESRLEGLDSVVAFVAE